MTAPRKRPEGVYRETSEADRLRAELADAHNKLAKIERARSAGVLYRIDGAVADWTYAAHTALWLVAVIAACVAGHHGATRPLWLTAACCAVSVYVFVRALPRAEDKR